MNHGGKIEGLKVLGAIARRLRIGDVLGDNALLLRQMAKLAAQHGEQRDLANVHDRDHEEIGLIAP